MKKKATALATGKSKVPLIDSLIAAPKSTVDTIFFLTDGDPTIGKTVDLAEIRDEVRRVNVGSKPFSLAVRQDGSILVVEAGDNTLSLYSADFQKLAEVKAGKGLQDIALSSDESLAYVTSERDHRVLVFQIR